MRNLINTVLSKFDMELVRKSTYQSLANSAVKFRDFELAEAMGGAHLGEFLANLEYSKSQLGQDLFVLSELAFKRNGFFVEFGATNGIELSNTYLLESKFGWNGILAEPAHLWHSELKANRTAFVETDCVWTRTGETLLFNEVLDEVHGGELSTIDSFSHSDAHQNARKSGSKYEVSTISLLDLLNKYDAPNEIDYLSIDTEGSEFPILDAFDFDSYNIKVITCEHNYTPMREKIFDLLTANGYVRKYSEKSRFDDWYVRR